MAGYARAYSNWLDYPNVTTPFTAAVGNKFDQAIFDLKNVALNLSDFGVKADGATDDSAAVQAALNAGRYIYVPQTLTSILIGSALNVAFDGTIVFGSGVESIFKKGFNGTLITSRHKNCIFSNFAIDGNRANFTGAGIAVAASAGNPAASDYAEVLDLYITGCQTNGITVNGSSHSTVRGCQVYDFAGVGIFLNGSTTNPDNARGNIIAGCHVESTANTQPGIQIRSDQANADTAYTNVADNYVSAQEFCIEVSWASPGTVQNGCRVGGNVCKSQGAGTINGGISLSGVANATVVGNTYDVNGLTAITAGIEIAQASVGVAVTGNQINGGSTLYKGIVIDKSSKCAVTGNQVNGFQNSPITNGGYGIRIFADGTGNANDNTVTGNNIALPAAGAVTGIEVECNAAGAHADRNIIVGNNVRGNGVASSVGTALNNFFGTVDKTLVDANANTNVTTPILQNGDTNTLLGTNQS